MQLTIVVSAFNEEAYLPATLCLTHDAVDEVRATSGIDLDIVVVENAIVDSTAVSVRDLGAGVVHELIPGIARAATPACAVRR